MKNLQGVTPEQRRILLVLCYARSCADAAASPRSRAVRLVCEPNDRGPGSHQPIRETTTGAALARKGLARRLYDDRFMATTAGFEYFDTLKFEDRLGRIPARRRRKE
jgi:hypothetical protein